MDQCYVVIAERADRAVRWAWVRSPTLPLTAERPGTSPNLFEPLKDALRSPPCPRDNNTILSMTVKALQDSSATLPLSLLFSLTGLGK